MADEHRQFTGPSDPLFHRVEAESRSLFTADLPREVPECQVTTAQREFVDRFIGTPHRLDPPALRRLVARSLRLDRFVPRSVLLDDGRRVIAPPALARRLGRPLRRLQKIGNSIGKRLPGRKRAA